MNILTNFIRIFLILILYITESLALIHRAVRTYVLCPRHDTLHATRFRPSNHCHLNDIVYKLIVVLKPFTMEIDGEVAIGEGRVPSIKFNDLVAWNFAEDGDDTFRCKNCGVQNVRRSGSNCNLIKHCAKNTCFGFKYRNVNDSRHNEDLQPIFRAYLDAMSRRNSISAHFKSALSPEALKIKAWIDLVVKCDLPLTVCENMIFREHVKVDGISRKTLRKYLIKLSDIVGLKIRDIIGPGNCIADGWSCNGVHYVGVIHSWPTITPSGNIVNKKALLSLAPLISETEFSAENHAESFEAVYSLYGSMQDLVVCFTLDNTNTNPKTTRLLNKPMIGAYCHRLNLASKCWLRDAFDKSLTKQLEVINAVMVRASSLKVRGRLKEHTPYLPEMRNQTRWTGACGMAFKYDAMYDALGSTGSFSRLTDDDAVEVDVDEVQDNDKDGKKTYINKKKKVKPVLMASSEYTAFKRTRLPPLKMLKNWFLVIQNDELNLMQARFQQASEHHLLKGHSDEFHERLSHDHKLVVAPYFESAVTKIIAKATEDFTDEEKEAARVLLKSKWPLLYPTEKRRRRRRNSEDDDEEEEEDETGSPTKFLRNLNKERTSKDDSMTSRYLTNLEWIQPTTVLVERLFSKCRHVFTYDRQRLLPRLFEAIIFLKSNQQYWNSKLVQEMMSGLWDERLGREYNSDDEEEED